MKLLRTIQKVPAGILLVPTIIGALIHTFCPQILEIGDPTQSMFTAAGMQLCIGLLLFFTGTQLSLSQLGLVAKKGLPFLLVKYGVAYGAALLFLSLFGQAGLLGVSFLAFAIAITSCNGALYMGIIEPYGNSVDYALFGILMMFSMPVLPMVLLNSANGGDINWMSIVSLLVPFIFGIVLGNIDPAIRDLFKSGNNCVLPFIGFQFGAVINLAEAAKQIPQGILLTVLFYVISIVPLYFFDRKVLHGGGYASVASCSVAGVALSIPMMAASAAGIYEPFVADAVSQLAMIMFITTFATPYITKFFIQKNHVKTNAEIAAEAASQGDKVTPLSVDELSEGAV